MLFRGCILHYHIFCLLVASSKSSNSSSFPCVSTPSSYILNPSSAACLPNSTSNSAVFLILLFLFLPTCSPSDPGASFYSGSRLFSSTSLFKSPSSVFFLCLPDFFLCFFSFFDFFSRLSAFDFLSFFFFLSSASYEPASL